MIIEIDRAAVRLHQADDHVKGGGLAGAVGAEQPQHFAAADFQFKPAHDFAAPVALFEPLRAQGANWLRHAEIMAQTLL